MNISSIWISAWPSRIVQSAFLVGVLLVSGCSAKPDAAAPSKAQQPQPTAYQLVPGALRETSTPRPPLTLRLLAPGSGQARIVDSDGNVLRAAPHGASIFSADVSPGGKHVLLYFGDARYTIASPDSLEDLLTLPDSPDGYPAATGFTWRLLGDEHLLGEAELPSTHTAGKTASEIDALSPSATLLYLYDIEGRTLTQVEIDERLPPNFLIHDVSGWNVTLLPFELDEPVGAMIVRSRN